MPASATREMATIGGVPGTSGSVTTRWTTVPSGAQMSTASWEKPRSTTGASRPRVCSARSGEFCSARPMPTGRSVSSRSSTSASTPARPSAMAAVIPAGPPPTTSTLTPAPPGPPVRSGRRSTPARRRRTRPATGAKTWPVGVAASAISRLIQALASSTSTVLGPRPRAPVTSIRQGAVQTIARSTPLTRTRARSPTSPRSRTVGPSIGPSSVDLGRVGAGPGEPGRRGPELGPGPGPPGRGVSRTPGRVSRHSPSSGPAGRPGRPTGPARPGTTNSDPSGWQVEPLPSAARVRRDRVPGRRAAYPMADRSGHRDRLGQRVGQEHHLAGRGPPADRGSSAPSTVERSRVPGLRRGRGPTPGRCPRAGRTAPRARASSWARDGDPAGRAAEERRPRPRPAPTGSATRAR